VNGGRRGPAARGDLLEQGRAAFNRREFFAAHERWEEAWRQLEGAERVPVQGLVQIAAGLHHLQQARPRPAGRLLAKGLEKLSQGVPAALDDLPVASLAEGVARLLAELEASPAGMPDLERLKL
jgi:predicted metal-dependent hydrolase